jgi:putative hydrolase of the HAD superfamily
MFRQPVLAVTFDAGGTLLHPSPSVGHVYAEVAAAHGCQADPAVLNRGFRAAWAAAPDFNHSRAEWAAVVDATFGPGLFPPPSRTFFDAIYRRFEDPAVWRLRPDALTCLQSLQAAGLKLGLISNWDERLRNLLPRLGLDGCFDVTVISCEAGCRKPDPAIFRRACAGLGVSPGQVLHVGDSWDLDVCGARAAGMQAAWLDGDPRRDSAATDSLAAICADLTGRIGLV